MCVCVILGITDMPDRFESRANWYQSVHKADFAELCKQNRFLSRYREALCCDNAAQRQNGYLAKSAPQGLKRHSNVIIIYCSSTNALD